MDVRVLSGDPLRHDTPLLALPTHPELNLEPGTVLHGADRALGGRVGGLLEAGEIRGTTDEAIALIAGGALGCRRVLLLGAGADEDRTLESVRQWVARAVRWAEAHRIGTVTVHLPEVVGADVPAVAQAGVEGGVLAGWRFTELKSDATLDAERAFQVHSLEVVDPGQEGFARGARDGEITARAENLARTLQARPGNVATPSHLGEVALGIADATGLDVEVWDRERIEREEMRALLAVSQGSVEEPRFIQLRHLGGVPGEPPVVLVGKGLTFDAGGISIKPSSGMEEMKFDMSAGAAVLAAMQAIAELQVPLNVVGLVPSSENLPSGSAVKPGDVIRTREGKTVEVINTDAEGRLILSDALSYAQTLEPAAIVDCATLTGSCIIALGHHRSAVLGNEDGLVDELRRAGKVSGERVWPLPLGPEYRKQLESTTADLKNVGGRPAGTITAACFLQEFVGSVDWAHLDVAGTAWGEGDPPYHRKGGTGVPTRLLVEWVRSRAG